MGDNSKDDPAALRRAAHLAELEAILRHGAPNKNATPMVPNNQLTQSQVIGLCILASSIAILSAWIGLQLWRLTRSIAL